MNFDQITERRGTDSTKWDRLDRACGLTSPEALAMWTADMDFAAPEFLHDAMRRLIDIGNYGYWCGIDSYHDAIANWMETRHGWHPENKWMFTTTGLGNGIAVTLHALTNPGDEVITFNPVYHEFASKISHAGRAAKQFPLCIEGGVFKMDFTAYEPLMTGKETAVLISSPHNPAGKIWSAEELNELGDFCERHNLLLISDEIHHDLIMPGFRFVPTYTALPRHRDRLVIMTAASKTFNIAGYRTGCVMIPSDELRTRFRKFFDSLELQPNRAGIELSKAAYSPEGAAWVDELVQYLDINQKMFNDAMSAIPGVNAMPMQATYLAWIDFAGTGMKMDEVHRRVYEKAQIGATWGPTLGPGGETCLRINIGTQRAHVEEAAERIQDAFSDLQ